jgi:LysM repeat protein
MPGVQVLGLDLGGLTRREASEAIARNWQRRTISLEGGDRQWRVAVPALGLGLDLEATVEDLFEQGRVLDRLGDRLRGEYVVTVEPQVVVDRATLEGALGQLKPELDRPVVDTTLRLSEGRVETVPPQVGQHFDLQSTAERLRKAPLESVLAGRLDLDVVPIVPLSVDVTPMVEQANRWLANTLSVEAYDPVSNNLSRWSFGPDEWGAWISMQVDAGDLATGQPALGWTFDVEAAWEALAARAAEMSPVSHGRFRSYVDLDKGAEAMREAVMGEQWRVRLRVYHHGGQHKVQSGETLSSIAQDVGIPYPWIEEVNPGVKDDLRVDQVINLPSPDLMLPLPVVEHKRIAISISRQRMWAYENGAVVWEWPVSTGISSSPTSPGVFQVQGRDTNAYASSWDLWMPYFVGIYRPVPSSDFMNGFHGFPTRDGASLLWTGSLGYPVTYGCILVSTYNAALLYDWAEDGVVVDIQP